MNSKVTKCRVYLQIYFLFSDLQWKDRKVMKLSLLVLRFFSTVSYLATSNRCLGEPLLTGSL